MGTYRKQKTLEPRRPVVNMVWRRHFTAKVTFGLALAVLYQSLWIVWNGADSIDMADDGGARRAEATLPVFDVFDVGQVESVFVAVVSMQRSSSTFLSHQVLTGQNHSKAESPINFAPPMSTCPLRHFVTLNEVFTNHPQQSGDAWQLEGAELVRGGTNPKDLTVEQLSDFLQRVAERRCRETVQVDLKLYKEKDSITQHNLLADCPGTLRHHQCSVSYKHFDFHLPIAKHDKVWKTLIPNLRLVILERNIKDRWSSFWVAQQTGDWNVHGTEEHKAKVAELKQNVPPVPDHFRNQHDNWYGFVRKSLESGGSLEGVPKMDLLFKDVVAKPLEVRLKALDMIWNQPATIVNERSLQPNERQYEKQHPTGSFANCAPANGALQPSPDTVTVSCKTFRYKLVEDTFRKAGPVLAGVLSSAYGIERREAIRATWAKDNGGVFFIVAGPWQIISQEFEQYGDMIWLDFEENYRSITEKTAAFLYLAEKITASLGVEYSYLVKVDDDTYLAQDRLMARFEWLSKETGSAPDMWGRCGAPPIIRDPENKWYVSREKYPEDNYPAYCQGGGYAMSRNFVRCAANDGHIASIRYFDFEDVFVGMLAERCGITSQANDSDLMRQLRSGWRKEETEGEKQNIQEKSQKVGSDDDSWLPKPEMARRIIQHNVFSTADMHGFHKSYLTHNAIAPTSIMVGDVLNYYYDERTIGWVEGMVRSVVEDEHNRKTVKMDFGPNLGAIEGILFDEAFSGRWSRASNSHRFTLPMLERMKSTLTDLENLSVPYYIYSNTTIDQSQSQVMQEAREKNYLDPDVTKYDHIEKDMMAEHNIMDALKSHPSRVHDPSEAELFVVPTPITEMALRGCHWDGCTWFDEAFDALEEQPNFKATRGNNHVLIATAWLAFSHRFSGIFPALSRNYRRLRNVTVAHNYDPYAVQEIQNVASGYEPLYELEIPVTRAFSLGLGYDKTLDIRVPSYENFEKAEHFLFYHSRNTTVQRFSFQTTKYRDAPFNKTVLDVIPTSSIGGPTSKERWLADFQSSKFCLVLRGDTPHSHAFLYSVRTGCIPVLVSDNYPEYAGPLKSSLSMKDFSIFITEEDFLRDPLKELLKLQSMRKHDIKHALRALAMAQRVIFPDHPQSLFVPAFLQEFKISQKQIPPSLPGAIPSADDISDISVTVQQKQFEIRYAQSTLSAISSAATTDKPTIVVAVITNAHRFRQRQAIRASWKKDQNLIFYVFDGDWAKIEKEFMEDGDIVWLRNPESTHADRALATLSFVDSYIPNYDYVLKINDNGCAYVNAAQDLLQQEPQEYWGVCPGPDTDKGRNFGYFLSKKLNSCSLEKERNAGILPQNDGDATRQLAQECGVTCNNKGWEWLGNPEQKSLWFMEDNIEETWDMMSIYWAFLQRRKIGEWAEG